MALALNEDWTADVVGRMHKFRIRNSDLAERAGYDPAYVSTVLNDSKTFGSPEAKEKTKQRILTALAELEQERMQEVEDAERSEDRSDSDPGSGDEESGSVADRPDAAGEVGSEN